MQGLTVCNLNKICLKQTGNKLKLYHTFLSLPRSRFLDVMQRSPKSSFGRVSRDIKKKRLQGRLYFALCCDEVVQRGISHCRERDMMSFLYNSKKTLDFLYNETQTGD